MGDSFSGLGVEGIEAVPDWLEGVDKDAEESGGESIPRSITWSIVEMKIFKLLTVNIIIMLILQ